MKIIKENQTKNKQYICRKCGKLFIDSKETNKCMCHDYILREIKWNVYLINAAEKGKYVLNIIKKYFL